MNHKRDHQRSLNLCPKEKWNFVLSEKKRQACGVQMALKGCDQLLQSKKNFLAFKIQMYNF